MKVLATIKNQALEELAALRQEIARLQTASAQYQATEAKLAQLASFPEQNPDILIETDLAGRIVYLNLVAQARFPEVWQQGFEHPLLQDMPQIIAQMQQQTQSYSVDEINLSDAAFERRICYTQDGDTVRIRVYAHDITQRKRAELAIHRLAKQVVFAQEEERRRLSRELHDDAGQALTALKLSLELLRADLPLDTEVLRRNLSEAITLTETTKERVRLLAHGLRPPALDTLGLNLTLESLCRDFAQRTQLLIKYQGSDIADLSDAVNICLYRVLQEALTNIVKHADASHVEVQLSCVDEHVQLIVTDNGCGIELTAQHNSDPQLGIGLLGMRERLELLGGKLQIESATDQGLRLTTTLPLAESP